MYSLQAAQQRLCTSHQLWYRAKAGGRQSTKDATGKSIKSAGAQIRRYNEVSNTQFTTNMVFASGKIHKVIGLRGGL